MGWFDKKKIKVVEEAKPAVKPKRTKKIVFSEQQINIGCTIIERTLSDGRIFNTRVYGNFNQIVHYGTDSDPHEKVREPSVGDPYVVNSLTIAKDDIREHWTGEQLLLNDSKMQMESVVGKVIGSKILKTVDFFEAYQVARIEDI